MLTAEIRALSTLAIDAETALALSSERTHTITVACRLAFEALTDKMRFFKNHYFLVPPLTLANLAELGLDFPDPSTPIPVPKAQPEADLTFPGIHLMELRNIRPSAGPGPDLRSDHGVRIYYGLSGTPTDTHPFQVTEVPMTGKMLPESLFTRRKKERFDL